MTTSPAPVGSGPTASLSFGASAPRAEAIARPSRLGGRDPDGRSIALTSYYLEIDGRPALPVMGEFHYARFPHRHWPDELRKIAAGGVDILSTYVFWIHHEEEEGVFDWSGDRDLRSFVRLCACHDLPVIVRIGPFAHGECRNGGLPDWLYGRPFAVRSTDERFLRYVRRLYGAIAEQLAGLLYKEGGPVIGVQLDNEYMHAGAPWETTYRQGSEWVPAGDEGVAYMRALKRLALEAGLDVPLYTCTGWVGSPVIEDELLPMQGGYAFTPWIPDPEYQQPPTREFLFRNRHADPVTGGAPAYDPSRYPLACCELGGGIQITYHHRPVVPPAYVEAMAVVALGSGANLLGYYMYHGGSQPVGRRGFLNEYTVPRISYDFQAPIREFGQLSGSYHRLRILHMFLRAFGHLLAPMGVALPDGAAGISPEDTATLRWAARARGDAGFLFLTNTQDHVETRDHHDIRLLVDTGHETVLVPSRGGLTLPSDTSAILPINLALGAHRLVYATAQPVTRLAGGETTDFVFCAVQGMPVEYAFARRTLADVQVTQGSVTEEDGHLLVRVSPGVGAAITLTAHDGTQVRVLTLTREQALRCWQVPICGRERLVLSEAMVLEGDGLLELESLGGEAIALSIYPPLPGGLETAEGRAAEDDEGLFARYSIPLPAQRPEIRLTPLGAGRYQVDLPGGIPPAAEDALLRIRYTGDIGEAYLDGRLIADNFCNGETWEIGLKRFADRLAGRELVIAIAPRPERQGGARIVPTGMAARPEAAQGASAAIESVEAVPIYRVVAWPGVGA